MPSCPSAPITATAVIGAAAYLRTRKLRAIDDFADKPRRALVTGIGGQDGSYLAELLLAKGYDVYGLVKSDPAKDRENLAAIRNRLDVRCVDLTDPAAVRELVADVRPHEIYNLAAPSVVGASWNDPPATVALMAGSAVCLLDAIATELPNARFFQATSSEIFRGTDVTPQNERTPPRPTSPYGVGKLAGHSLVHAYRERHGLHASSGVLYNHESPRRPVDFVPSKIVNAAAQIKLGNESELALGDRTARRDWGFAGDYVDAMWRMLQHETPADYVIATGVTHSVDDLVNAAFSLLDLDPARYVRTDPRFLRAGDEAQLVGDPSLIANELGWRAETSFDELVRIMVEGCMAAAGAPAELTAGGEL